MKLNRFLLVLLVILAGVLVWFETQRYFQPKYRVVFDMSVSDPESWNTLLRNITNLKIALGSNVQIKVVAYSKGLDLLLTKDKDVAAKIGSLEVEGVSFAACNNTIKAKGVTPQELLPQSQVVDSGVAELARLQAEGWSYIKVSNYGAEN